MAIAVQETRQERRGCDVGIDLGRRESELTDSEIGWIKEAKDYFESFKEPLMLRLILENGLFKCSLYKGNPDICKIHDCPRYR